ncbi:urease accessory protein UreF [Abditibacteriota bacterium]|nr:urease accessory protein UreF [Abditibacteriota bacterium]
MNLAHIQLLDSALPTGAFSHSFGLETFVQSGRIQTAEHLREYAQTMLFGAWASGDAMAVKAVYEWAPAEKYDELWRLDKAMHIARTARESREGTHKIGKRLLTLARTIHPDLNWQPLTKAVEADHCPGTFPLIYGYTCRELDVPLTTATEGFLYANLSTTFTNAVRAMRLGGTQAQTILAAMLPLISQAWQQNQSRAPWKFAYSTPATDIAMMEHETLYSRLFMS